MINAIAFMAFCALANRIRGGLLDVRLGIDSNSGIRYTSAAIVGLAALGFMVQDWRALWIAAAFFLFHLPGWGAWFDFTDAPQPRRGNGPPQWVYDALAPRFGPYPAKWAAMVLRGLYSAILFVPLALWSGAWIAFLSFPYAFVWAFCYCAWHRWRWPIHAEISTGLLFGAAVALSL